MYPVASDRLRGIKTFLQLTAYLREELDWPLNDYVFDELTFEYQPSELGLKDLDAAQATIHQLRPLVAGQPWGIFFIEFDKNRLPVVVLRRILSHLVVKKRASSNRAERAAWHVGDLLFISAFGNVATDGREIAFAHFHQESGDLPTLHVLGWDGGNTSLTLSSIEETLKARLCWPKDSSNAEAWRKQWGGAFRHRIGHIIRTATKLAEVLATLARDIRDRAKTMLAAENERGPLTKLFQAFQTALLHDLTPETFADTYAQTITYGLLTAAFSFSEISRSRNGTAFVADSVADVVPITNPFLKEMLQTFLKVGGRKANMDFDELGIQDVVEILRSDETDLPAIIKDFGNKNSDRDPVIHFYEHFLAAYDKELKVQRGVFFTPQPVVSYIVRSVHELLQSEFGLVDGLADTATWAAVAKYKGLKIPPGTDPNSAFVQILDPATGTATFLVEVINLIHRTLAAKWEKEGRTERQRLAAWNEYVPRHLLSRLHGYELMMAPYAIAHMKIGLKLHETGYNFDNKERVRIYLTNALEPPEDFSDRLAFDAPALAHEAQAVNDIKRSQRFTVVIGNPPYSGNSANTGGWISRLVREYYFVDGATLGERNPKWLQDDYVKFIRAGQEFCRKASVGLLALVTNHGYIDNPTFRGMRKSLITQFSQMWLLDLHGNIKKKEAAPDGALDQNVFDIQQGVAVFIATHGTQTHQRIRHSDLFGTRAIKYYFMSSNSVISVPWRRVDPTEPFYMFRPENADIRKEYLKYPSIKQVMPVKVLGFQTHRDHFAIAFEKEALAARFEALRLSSLTDAQIEARFELKDNDDWNIQEARATITADTAWRRHIIQCLYRPFDTRWCYFNTVAMDRPRRELLDHVAGKQNICLLISRQISFLPWQHAGVSDTVAESCVVSTKTKEGNYNFPLYLYAERNSLKLASGRRINFSAAFLHDLANLMQRSQKGQHGLPQGLTPEDVLNYVYAVLYSPSYRKRYEEFLRIDFPRIPLTASLELFYELCQLGGDLVSLHLLTSSKVDRPAVAYTGPARPKVEKVFYANDIVWLDKSLTSAFRFVPQIVWNFHIGGYQVCEKWLKDRKGRILSKDDIAHYQKIVTALSETIRLMAEIDATIEKHGGWPTAFVDKLLLPLKPLKLKPTRGLVKLHPAL